MHDKVAISHVNILMKHLKPTSQRTYRYAFKLWMRHLRGKRVLLARPSDATTFIADLYSKSMSDASIKLIYAALSAIHGYFHECELVERNVFNAASRVIAWHQRRQVRPTATLDRAKVLSVIRSIPHDTKRGIRDRAVLSVLFGCGLRRSELINLKVGDVKVSGYGTLYLHIQTAKAGIGRSQPLPEWVWPTLSLIVSDRRAQQADEDDYLFVSTHGECAGRQPISAETVARIFGRYFDGAPHAARAAFATRLKEMGHSDREVADALGHSSTAQVIVYDKRERGVETNVGKLVDYEKPIASVVNGR